MDLDQLKRIVTANRHTSDGSARAIRRRAGLTLEEFAERVGVDQSTMSRWENGQRRPRGDAACRWLTALEELAQADPAPNAQPVE